MEELIEVCQLYKTEDYFRTIFNLNFILVENKIDVQQIIDLIDNCNLFSNLIENNFYYSEMTEISYCIISQKNGKKVCINKCIKNPLFLPKIDESKKAKLIKTSKLLELHGNSYDALKDFILYTTNVYITYILKKIKVKIIKKQILTNLIINISE